ncbi:hypothetical protein Nmel_017026, partial [Mimus melanotis]
MMKHLPQLSLNPIAQLQIRTLASGTREIFLLDVFLGTRNSLGRCPSSSGCFPCGPEQALDGTFGSCLWHFPWPAAPPRCPAKQQGLDGCHQRC